MALQVKAFAAHAWQSSLAAMPSGSNVLVLHMSRTPRKTGFRDETQTEAIHVEYTPSQERQARPASLVIFLSEVEGETQPSKVGLRLPHDHTHTHTILYKETYTDTHNNTLVTHTHT